MHYTAVMLKIILNGATGRMGQAVLVAAAESGDVTVVAGTAGSHHDRSEVGGVPLVRDLHEIDSAFDALIDFSTPEGQAQAVGYCLERQKPLVSGTTGLGEKQRQALLDTDWEIPVVFSPNMSAGVALMRALIHQAAAHLPKDTEIEIVETHHRHKIDAPSGTALSLGQAAAKARGQSLDSAAVHGRQGRVGPRGSGEIGFHAVRGGDVIGDHSVRFFSRGESLEITHQSTSRRGFAEGALQAARWVVEQQPGVYAMDHVLGLADA